MCGIAGEIDYREQHPEEKYTREKILLAMRGTLRRRGPDQNGIILMPHAALAHTRLSVIDLENGSQPMRRGNSIIVYNGELYNTPELRRELAAAGWEFQGHSDTEVALLSWLEWGETCVERMNGIFAFAIWDETRERLFLARDRMGVKPLFFSRVHTYDENHKKLVFASEIKALLQHPDIPAEIDSNGIAELALIGPGRTPGQGVFRGIEELLPGQCAIFDREGLHTRMYWQLRAMPHLENTEDTIAHLRWLLQDVVRRQLIADVPTGCFLSGGLDSSLLSSIAAKIFRKEGKILPTFSVDYQENARYFVTGKFQPSSDEPFIREMAEYLGSRHRNIVLDPVQVADALLPATEARDLPGMADIDSSLLLFCQAVREDIIVSLSGECADEIFGGYPWFRDPTVQPENGFPWAQTTAWRAEFLIPDYARQIQPEEYVRERYQSALQDLDILDSDSPEQRRIRGLMRMNMHWFMQTLLDRKDRMSMWSALEVRVPFCDWRIAEYLYNVPPELRELDGQEKGLLRRAAKGFLPESVRRRKKSPYPKTVHPAYLQAVTQRLQAILKENTSPLFTFIRREALETLCHSEGDNRDCPWYGQLMTRPQTIAYFVQLNHWLRNYHVKIL